METGTITELLDRNRGFIKQTGASEGLFFHADDLVDMQFTELHTGDKVQFSVVTNSKGSYATEIRGMLKKTA